MDLTHPLSNNRSSICIIGCSVEQRFGDVKLRAKSHLLKESGDNTDRESARQSVSTSACATGGAGSGAEATMTKRGLHEHELCALRLYLVRTWVNIPSTKEPVTAMQAEVAALRQHVQKLILVGKIVASHRIK